MRESKFKGAGLLTSVLLFITNAAAQIRVGDQEYESLAEFITEFYGLPSLGGGESGSGIETTIGYLAGFFVFDMIFYYGILVAIRRSNSDTLAGAAGINPRNSAGFEFSRSLFALSTASILTIFSLGAGALKGSIISLAAVAFLGVSGLVVVFALYLFAGFIGGTAGGVSATAGAGRYAGETAADIRDSLNDLRTAEQEDEDGRTEEAIRDMERALRELEEAEEDLDEMLEADITELEDAVQVARDIYGVEEREVEWEEEIDQLDERIRNDLRQILQRDWNNTPGDLNDLSDIFDEIEQALGKIESDLKDIDDAESSDPSVDRELQELEDAANSTLESFKLLRKLEGFLEEGEGEIEHLASEVGENDEIQAEENQIRQLEQQFEQLEALEQRAISELEDAIEILERQMALTEEEREILVELFQENNYQDSVQRLRSHLGDQLPDPSIYSDTVDQIEEIVENEILPELQRLESHDEEAETKEKKVLSELRQILDQIQG